MLLFLGLAYGSQAQDTTAEPESEGEVTGEPEGEGNAEGEGEGEAEAEGTGTPKGNPIVPD